MYNDYNEVRAHLAHFGITGQKKGLRRFQSYQVAPTQSGMVGQEVGEAAKQRSRIADTLDRISENNTPAKRAERKQMKAEKRESDKKAKAERQQARRDKAASAVIDVLVSGVSKMGDSYNNRQLKQIETGKFRPDATTPISKNIQRQWKEKDPKAYEKWVNARKKYRDNFR